MGAQAGALALHAQATGACAGQRRGPCRRRPEAQARVKAQATGALGSLYVWNPRLLQVLAQDGREPWRFLLL